ncbi:GDSL-like Lipase/Acylhydrolase [Hyaloscypha finlandica]|nr:GDSL-like Lipase/Acylhydrolase [Hyaloscypha finlandica]
MPDLFAHPIPTIFLAGDSTEAPGGGRNGTEGRFQAIADLVKPGDWVIIEFGHNDGGSPYPASSDIGRADCPGAENETCPTVYSNKSYKTEIAQTYPTCLINASTIFLSKGAKVILSSPAPSNPWEKGNYSYTPSIFNYYSSLATTELGGPKSGGIVNENYPMDHMHTEPYLGDVVARSFVLGLKCGTAPLAGLVMNATSRLEGELLGTCLSVNETVPI